jgi:RNA polymerase sigma-70 factor (ECF subfamily)
MTMSRAEVLIAGARQGDAAAIEQFVQETMPDVWRFMAHLIGVDCADDLTQETFERALTALPAFRGGSSARTWLLSIARRVAVDELRRRGRRRGIAAAAQDTSSWSSPPEPESVTDDPAERVVVRDLLNRLAPDRREAFVLTQVIGLEYAEAADLCNCPIGTIRSRVARARDDLAQMLGAHAQAGPRLRTTRPA